MAGEPRTVDLDALSALLAAATPGPWRSRRGFGPDKFMPKGYKYVQFGPTEKKAAGLGTDQLSPADADLIAAAVNALPSLIEAAQREAGLREALRKIVTGADNDSLHPTTIAPSFLAEARDLLHDNAGTAER